MRDRPPRARAEVFLRWGDILLAGAVVRSGARYTIGPDPRSSFAIPWRPPCSIRVDGAVVSFATASGARALATNESLRHTIGALTLSVRAEPDEPGPSPFERWKGAWRALAVGWVVVAHLAVLAFATAPAPRASARPEARPRLALFLDASAPGDAKPEIFSVETEPTRPLVAPEAAPSERDSAMLLPETASRQRDAERPKRAGELARFAPADLRVGGTGRRALRAEGPIGNPLAPRLPYSWAIRERSERPRPARDARLAAYWPVWTLTPEATELPDERVAAPFGEQDPVGRDDSAALGNMFGSEPEDPLGAALGAEGHGPGGGGRAESIGMGSRGELGHGSSTAGGEGAGVAPPASAFGRDARVGAHLPGAPSLHTRVDREVVLRVLSRNAGLLRACTASGPTSVDLELVVHPDGSASSLSLTSDQDLGRGARACLARAVGGLRFLPAGRDAVRVSARIRL